MIKSFIRFGLEKSILNHMLLFFILVLSVFSYLKIPKEIFPPSSLNKISISGGYAGASSDILNLMAVSKIEDDLSSLSDIDTISTMIKTSYFNISVGLKDGYEISKALEDIKDIVSKIQSDLPSDMQIPNVKRLTLSFPLISVVLYGDTSKQHLIQVAKKIKSKLSKLNDLSDINIWGDSQKQLYITLNEAKLKAFNLNKNAVISTISQMSSIFPIGTIEDEKKHYYLSSQNGEKDIQKLENSVIKIGQKQLFIKDIATLSYNLAKEKTLSHFNGQPNITIGINKGKNGNSIALVKQIKQILKKEKIKYKIVNFDTFVDSSVWIKNRLNTVFSNIVFGLILLTIALLLFINFSIALVVAIGIPVSFMIGIIGAYQLGHSINMLSLLSALLALGMLVDEAIVVGENIYRHFEMGKDKMSATIDGTVEMFPAVLTATFTTIFAFLPILLMTGETGLFMRIIPIMVTILLLSSLFEAFFFLPLHAKHLLKVNKKDKLSDRFWEKNKRLYKKILTFLLRWKYMPTIFLVVLTLFATFSIVKISKFRFMPEFDTTQVLISGAVSPKNSLEQTEIIVKKLENKLLENFKLDDEISSISSIVGMKLDGQMMMKSEEFYFQLTIDLQERKPSNFFNKYINPVLSPMYDDINMRRVQDAKSIAKQIRKVLDKELNSKVFDELKVKVPGAGIVKNDIEISLSANNKGEKDKIQNSIKIIKKSLNNIKGVENISDDTLMGNIDLKFKVNDYGQSLGFNETNIVNSLRAYYSSSSLGKMYGDSGIIDINFQTNYKNIREKLDDFELNIPNSSKSIALKDIVIFINQPSQTQIYKENGIAIRTITASLSDISSSEVYKKLQPTLDKLKDDITIDIKGEQKENKKVQGEMIESFIIAIILIFITLVWMFNSIVKSIIILSTIPLSLLGVLAGHIIVGVDMTVPGLIGVVGLAGVIVNDGIIMMDFIKKATNLDELKNLATLRLRPILLTSLTTILGLSTLIFFASGQALILQPMAISLGFGLLWATVLNLYYIPMLYRIVYLRRY
jgi:multidrug efflux pump subunit AcrB